MKEFEPGNASFEEEISLQSPKTGNLMDSKVSCLTDIIHEKFDKAFNNETSKVSLHDIAKIALEHGPIDLANAVCHLAPMARPVLFENLPDRDAKIQFLLNTDQDSRLLILRFMKDRELKELIEKMSADQAIRIIEDLSERRFRRILEFIPQKKAMAIRELQRHHRNSASRLMTSAYFAFKPHMTVGEASVCIRDNPRIDFSKGIFVVNEENELLGFVPGRNLIINEAHISIKQVMRPIQHMVSPDASREEVVDIVERYKVAFLPVVDDQNRLLGVISYDNVVEAMEDLADETLAKIAGTAENVTADEPVRKRILARSPWLLVTLGAGLINSMIMSYFGRFEGAFLSLVTCFVPLITGLSGNIGIQCSTVLVRGMAIGTVSAKTKNEAATKELLVGLFTGVIFGVGVGVLVYFIDSFISTALGPFALATTVGMGLIGACLAGTALGVFSPLFFAKIGVDPAIASGPIVTAFNDVFSMGIYFLIAWGLGSILL